VASSQVKLFWLTNPAGLGLYVFPGGIVACPGWRYAGEYPGWDSQSQEDKGNQTSCHYRTDKLDYAHLKAPSLGIGLREALLLVVWVRHFIRRRLASSMAGSRGKKDAQIRIQGIMSNSRGLCITATGRGSDTPTTAVYVTAYCSVERSGVNRSPL
jgi:hypothetical protein